MLMFADKVGGGGQMLTSAKKAKNIQGKKLSRISLITLIQVADNFSGKINQN